MRRWSLSADVADVTGPPGQTSDERSTSSCLPVAGCFYENLEDRQSRFAQHQMCSAFGVLYTVAWWCNGYGVGLAFDGARVRFPAVSLPSSNRGPVALCTLGLGLLNPPSLWSVNRVLACLARVEAGCVRLCRVAGNTVWSHTASDTP